MKRFFAAAILLAVITLMLFSCANNAKPSGMSISNERATSDYRIKNGVIPNSDFEFDLLTDAKDIDFEGYEKEKGFGVWSYTKNTPNGTVRYATTAYPDYADGGQFITRIYSTDNTIRFFGVTLESSREEIISALESYGYTVTTRSPSGAYGYIITGSKDNISVTVSILNDGQKGVNIIAEVTNREMIIF